MTRFGIGAFGWCVANCGACSFILWHTVKCAMNVILYFAFSFVLSISNEDFEEVFVNLLSMFQLASFYISLSFYFGIEIFLYCYCALFIHFHRCIFFFNRVALLLLFMQPIDPNISKHWNKFACRRRKRDIHRRKREIFKSEDGRAREQKRNRRIEKKIERKRDRE